MTSLYIIIEYIDSVMPIPCRALTVQCAMCMLRVWSLESPWCRLPLCPRHPQHNTHSPLQRVRAATLVTIIITITIIVM